MINPLYLKTAYYIIISLIVLTVVIAQNSKNDYSVYKYSKFIVIILALTSILFIGFRNTDIITSFTADTPTYVYQYSTFSIGDIDTQEDSDLGFSVLMYICKCLGVPVRLFLIICASIYIIPLVFVSRKLSSKYAYLIMIMFVTGFSFFNSGANIMRNGMALSLLWLSFINYKKILPFSIYGICALLMHKSIILPLSAFILARLYTNHKLYMLIWLLAIPLSFVVKDLVSEIILSIDYVDDRAEYYFTHEASLDQFSKVGFRYDFLIYGAVPIMVGGYFIFIKEFKDQFYNLLYATYLTANAGWIVINEVPFSSRFAILSWFLLPLLIIYPFIFYSHINRRLTKISLTIILHLGFTWIMLFSQ